jgi:hypothetical protein
MQIYSNMPVELVRGWVPSDEHEDFTGKPIGFHYHDVVEWLQVTKGNELATQFSMRVYSQAHPTPGARDATAIAGIALCRPEVFRFF